MIRIESYATDKDNAKVLNNNGNTGFAGSTNTTNIQTGVNGVNIWGQYHDHTKDIDGDMSNVGNISATGNITTTGNVNATNITASGNATSNQVITGNINSNGDISTHNITTSGGIYSSGRIYSESYVQADSGLYTDGNVICEDLEASSGNIGTLLSGNITCENLLVTNAAHFFKLIIDEIKSTQGQIIVTPSNAKIDIVEQPQSNRYDLFFRADDNEANPQKISNMFEADDQILCQTFNTATGTNYNVSNKFYWAKCIYVSHAPVDKMLNGKLLSFHKITLDWTDKSTNTNGIPEVGDEIVTLGNRTDTNRQAAITIGAYDNAYLDPSIHAPFICQYNGINDYYLSTHRGNTISNGYNYFKGEFYTTTGDDIEDLINNVSVGTTAYVHTAYANSADGQTNFSKTYFNNALYIGFCSNHTQSDSNLIYSDYTWCRLRGDNGQSASNYDLQSDSLTIHVKEDNTSTDSDFTVRGYEFTGSGKVEVDNTCLLTYIYENSNNNSTSTRTLPITISPVQEDQAFTNGLKTIRFQMKDENNVNIVAQLDIPIVRDGATGEDLEEYKLVPITEQVPIDKNGVVGVFLTYNIMHIVGGRYELVNSSNALNVYFKPHFTTSTQTYTALSTGTTTPTYSNASYQTAYNTRANKLLYLDIVLANYNPDLNIPSTPLKVYDKRVVYASMLPSASFEITDEIKAVVTGHTNQINGITNSISTIEQAFNAISLTVESHTTLIDGLDGRVTTNETDIANLTIQADSIQSTVQNLKAGAKNLFNFTYCRWQNAVPFIKAYGIEGKGTRTRIYNLGFDNIGGDFSVSCWMRMKTTNCYVNVNICDVNDRDHNSVSVTTTWKQYTFHYSNISRYMGEPNDTWNGFIDFESADISNSNRLYVKELMITRGNVPSDFYPSDKDYDNINTDNIIDFTYDPKILPNGEKYKGFDVYSPTEYPTQGNYDFIYSNQHTLKTNTPYTLSFYAKADYPLKIESYLYANGGCVDGTCGIINNIDNTGTVSVSNYSDGLTTCHIGTDWKLYTIYWFNQNSGQRNILVYRDNPDNHDDIDHDPNIKICGIQFKEGYYNKDLLNSQSLIRQTADEIELKVNNTGININDGSITLNAENTTIIGNLTLKDNNQGLVIIDQYNNPKITIQNESLGNLDDFDFGSDKRFTATNTQSVSTQTYNINFAAISLGNYTAGQKLNIHDIAVTTGNREHYFATYDDMQSVTYSYTIKCSSTTVATITGTATMQDYQWKLSDYNNNSVANSGTYTIEIHLTCNLRTTELFGEFSNRVYLYARRTQTNINKIANDGALFSYNNERYSWFGNDQTMLRNGATALRLKDGKIQVNERWIENPTWNTHFMDFSSALPYRVVNAITYTATLDDGLIVFSMVMDESADATRTLSLPNPNSCGGKVYYVKNIEGNRTTVTVQGQTTSNRYFIGSSTNDTSNTISITNKSTMLISTGAYWLVFNCG